MIAVFGIGLALIIFLAIALFGEALVWRIPAYSQFQTLVENVENIGVTQIRGRRVNETLYSLAIERINNVFVSDDRLGNELTIGQCFGVMFFREKAIDEAVSNMTIAARMTIVAIIIGSVVIGIREPEFFNVSTTWEALTKVPEFGRKLMEGEFILLTEVLIVAFSLMSLLHTAALLNQMNKLQRSHRLKKT